MSMSTMSTIFSENAEQFSDELTTALAAGHWWAIMEVLHPISEEPEYGDLTSGQWGETMEAGEASCPTSLLFSDASEKAQRKFQHSGFSDASLKSTKQWRQSTIQGAPFAAMAKQGAPVPPASSEKGDLTSSMVFSDSSEKAPNSDLSDAPLKTMEQQQKRRKKKCQGLAKAAGSEKTEGGNLTSFPVLSDASEKAMKQHKLAPVPAGSQKKGKLSIPEHLTNCLQKASFEQGARMPSVSLQETPIPTKSLQRAPVAAPKVLACSQHGALMPGKIQDRRKLKIPERLRQELLQQKPQASLQGAPMPDKIPNRQKLKIPDLLKRELLQQKPLASPLKTAPASCAQGAPVTDMISEKRNLKNSELQRKELLEKDAVIPDTTPVGAPVHVGTQQGATAPPRSPHVAPVSAGSPKGAAVSAHTKKPQASCALAQTLPGAPITSPQEASITSPQGAPMPSQRKRVCPWSTAASDNADLCQSPSQKLCVEIDDLIEKVQLILKLDSYNHQAPLIATSKLNQGTHRSLQSWKKALDSAGVDQSLPQKKSSQ